ncbi:ABC transporter substrate-binding protein [Brevibacillus ruminantium]|uniref:ABC transporter substrate-binding protein n=1 Tax=Brevibacillus ruminantium TaxID=2950604 RepID=A0ABY4WC93_9BACL|nr:ABC transporter substrate-binding protein [Brevibacillus ruminantium]USG64524.1 ABC transporter substrate-binding protein [Brevibacillus ruminantium]
MHRTRHAFFLTCVVLAAMGLLFLLIASNRSEPLPVSRIGVVVSNEGRTEKIAGLKEGMEKLGLPEGKRVEYLTVRLLPDQDHYRNDEAVDALLRAHPDVVVTAGAKETAAVQTAVARMALPAPPIVFIGVALPSVLSSSAASAGQVTGVDNAQMSLIGKRLELIVRLLPHAENVLVIADDQTPLFQKGIEEAQMAATKLGIRTEIATISSTADVERELEQLPAGKYDALLPLPSLILEDAITDALPLLTEKRLFVMGAYPEQVKKGLFAAYGVSFFEQGEQASMLVANLLDGVPVSKLPIQWPNHVKLSLHTASIAKLSIPLSDRQLSLADELYGGDE